MSDMLRINSRVYIRKSCIEVIEQEEDSVYVYTSTSKFKSDVPLWQIINMLDLDDIAKEKREPVEEESSVGVDLSKQFVSL